MNWNWIDCIRCVSFSFSFIALTQLQPNDQILAVNGEDVKDAPRDHVIQLVRACETQVNLLVCQPEMLPCSPGRKSTLLSAARKEKLRNKRPSRVRFAESVCVNGAPLFPVSLHPCFLFVFGFLVSLLNRKMCPFILNGNPSKLFRMRIDSMPHG